MAVGSGRERRIIKCVVWDLDDTLWRGTLLEDGEVALREGVAEVVRTLDERGILQSVASKNDHAQAMERLEAFGLAEYFLYPHVNWNAKSASIRGIVSAINIGMDAVAFVDDQPFEREEVAHELPEVLCIDAAELSGLLARPELNPPFVTEDSRQRRRMYLSDIERARVEEAFVGPQEAFLATLGMRFSIGTATEYDLQRAEELTVRTNQLNSTGYTYSYDELNAFRGSDRHKLLIAGLEDRYGSYGKIGLALLECGDEVWTVKLLLMSCRVVSRGVGTIMMNHVLAMARAAGVRLRAEFRPNGRNRMMYVTFRFGGFREVETRNDLVVFEADLARIQPVPPYVELELLDDGARATAPRTPRR